MVRRRRASKVCSAVHFGDVSGCDVALSVKRESDAAADEDARWIQGEAVAMVIGSVVETFDDGETALVRVKIKDVGDLLLPLDESAFQAWDAEKKLLVRARRQYGAGAQMNSLKLTRVNY